MKRENRIITECAISIALSFVLSCIPIFKMPSGGSITLASTAPIIILSFRRNYNWGVIAGLIYSLLQLFYGFHFPPSKTMYSLLMVILLDYMISYTCLGLSSITKYICKNKYVSLILGIVLSFTTRLICSTTSGILVWKDYFPSGIPIWLYSITYNITYLVPEYVITAIACFVITKRLDKNNIF